MKKKRAGQQLSQFGFSWKRCWNSVWNETCLLHINICEGKREETGQDIGRSQTAMAWPSSTISAGSSGAKTVHSFLSWAEIARPLYEMCAAQGRVGHCLRQLSARNADHEAPDSGGLSADYIPSSWVTNASFKGSEGWVVPLHM